jgi:hypothetical protein
MNLHWGCREEYKVLCLIGTLGFEEVCVSKAQPYPSRTMRRPKADGHAVHTLCLGNLLELKLHPWNMQVSAMEEGVGQ